MFIFGKIKNLRMPVYLLMLGSFGLGTVSLGEIAGANIRVWEVLLILFIFVSIFEQRLYLLNFTPFVLSFILLSAVFISGVNPLNSFLYIKQTMLFTMMILLFVLVAQSNNEEQLVKIIRWIVYPGVFVAGWGVLELFLYPEDLQVYSSENGLWFRARSFFSEANEFSQYLAVPFGFILGMIFCYKPLGRFEVYLLKFSLFLVVVAQLISFSRGGILSFAAELIALSLLARGGKFNRRTHLNRLFKIALLLVFLISIFFLLDSILINVLLIVYERILSLFSSNDATTFTRLDTIYIALSSALQSPFSFLFGIGFGNLPQVLGEGVANSGNLLVDIFSEIGLIGLFAFCVLIFSCLIMPISALKIINSGNNHKLLAVFYGAYLSFVGLLCGGLTSPTHMLNIFWFCAGVLIALHLFGVNQQKKLTSKKAS